MQRRYRWMILVLLIAGLLLSACVSSTDEPHEEEAVHIEKIEGEGDLNRIKLSERAVERLAIETVPVVEEEVNRMRTVGGWLVLAGSAITLKQVSSTDTTTDTQPTAGAGPSSGAAGDGLLVLVSLNGNEIDQVERDAPAFVLPLTGDEDAKGMTAQPVAGPAGSDPESANGALYFALDREDHGWPVGQEVLVELALSGGGMRLLVPYSSVIYDLQGRTWVYTSPEALVYVRHPIVVDYIEDDVAVLLEGPPVGADVVTVAVVELWGAETGVGGGH